jgi:hypothetical protein
MKSNRWFMLVAVCFILAVLTVAAKAQAAGAVTNVVTLTWTGPTNSSVPYVYEIQQSSLNTNNWLTLIANVQSSSSNFTMVVDKELKFFRIRAVNATNSAWFSDFSNTASTLWPGQGGNLGIRLGP